MAFVILHPDKIFPVPKIIGVGQNYKQHITEMGAAQNHPPVLFLKPPTAILNEGKPILLPVYSHSVHHEIELALLIGKTGKNIEAKDWSQYVTGAGIALDLTLRDLQRQAKDRGEPWSVSKGFDGSCPISKFTPLTRISNLNNLQIELEVNHQLRQKASTAEMIYPVEQLIAYISAYFTLEQGDIILTGTPAGVGNIISGDLLQARIGELGEIEFKVA
jgi:2-keto-4-pentenoate hydratase/2-oxohepta-3-ene-1,7-dioic acid hydratase in catechol pathway